MNTLRIVRIALMVVGIFATGIATGRYITPPAQVVATNMHFSNREGRTITPRFIVTYFDQRLQLVPSQKKAILGEARVFIDEVAATQPATQQRFDVFLKYYPKIRALLREDQYGAFDELVKTQKQRMDEILREAAAESKSGAS